MADTYEKDLGQKSSLTTSDFIRVVGSDNVSYKQSVSSVKTAMGVDDATKHIRVNHSNIASGGTWSVALRDAGTGVYHYGLLVGGSGQQSPYLAHVFIGSGANAPVVITNVLHNTFTVSGTCSNGTVTFTVNGSTAYGGLRYIDLA